MSTYTGTFNGDNQSSNAITLKPGNSVSYSITTASLTGSVVFEKTHKLGEGYTTTVDTMTATDSGTYTNETDVEEYVRLRCVELDDDPGSETVTYSLADVSQNNSFEYIDPWYRVKQGQVSDFALTMLDDTDASTVRETLGVPSIIDVSDAQASVLDTLDFTSAEPGSPTDGDRYINSATGVSSETSQSVNANYIYQWNSSTSVWDETIPTEGAICTDEDANQTLLYNGSAWIALAGYAFTSAQYTSLVNIVTAGYAENINQELTTTSNVTFGRVANTQIQTYEATNDGNPQWAIGSSSNERGLIKAIYNSGTQTLDYMEFRSEEASADANKGAWRFYVDSLLIGTFQDDGLNLNSSKVLSVNDTQVVGAQQTNIADLTDSSGGSADGTVAAITGSGADTDINNNFAEVTTKINALITGLEAHGLFASS